MKKIITAVIITLLIPMGYIGAGDKQSAGPVDEEASMSLKESPPLPAEYTYYFYTDGMTDETEKADFLDCTKRRRRNMGFGRMRTGGEKAKPYKGHHSTFWVTFQCGE